MATQPAILVVDDDPRLRDLLQDYLTQQAFNVTCVEDGISMDTQLNEQAFDLAILDIMLPGEDGLSLCKRVRTDYPDMGIIMLTAKGDEIDRIIGLELGADDYLPKPFNPRELVARIKAILRRKVDQDSQKKRSKCLEFSDFSLDIERRQLSKNGEPISITTAEYTLLKVFAENPNRPLSRDQLMSLSKGRDHNPYDRSIDVFISRLRKSIEPDPSNPVFIQTVWGHGYVFVPDGKAS